MDQQRIRHRRRLAGLALPLVLLVVQTTADSTEAPDLPHPAPPAVIGRRIPSPPDLPSLSSVRSGLPQVWQLDLSGVDPGHVVRLDAVPAPGAVEDGMVAGTDMADASAALADRTFDNPEVGDVRLAGRVPAAVAEPPGLAVLGLALAMLGAARRRYRGRHQFLRPRAPEPGHGTASG